MAISDLVQSHQTLSSSKDSPEIKPPSLLRFEFIVKSMAKNAIKGPGTSSQHRTTMHIIEMIFDEAVQELVDNHVEDDVMSKWIFWFGKLFEWCATGELEGLPEDMRDIVGELIIPGEILPAGIVEAQSAST
jgi:hypothetical protein